MHRHGFSYVKADGAADEGKLLIGVAAAIVDIKFCRDPVGGHGVLEHLLEVIGIVAVEEPAAHQETGVVINDHDAVDPPALAVLRDIRKIARIGQAMPAWLSTSFPKESSSNAFLSRMFGFRADLRSWFFTKRWTAQTLTVAGMNAVSTRCLWIWVEFSLGKASLSR